MAYSPLVDDLLTPLGSDTHIPGHPSMGYPCPLAQALIVLWATVTPVNTLLPRASKLQSPDSNPSLSDADPKITVVSKLSREGARFISQGNFPNSRELRSFLASARAASPGGGKTGTPPVALLVGCTPAPLLLPAHGFRRDLGSPQG